MAIELLNTSAIAKLTGIKKETLVGLRKRGLGPKAVQFGREYLYDKEMVMEWLKNLYTPE